MWRTNKKRLSLILILLIRRIISYNTPFTLYELSASLQNSHDTACGADLILYQLLKHLSEQSLLVLLKMFNHIWKTGTVPKLWKEALVIPMPKPGKDHDPWNYRPIALTSCLCKTMERMVNGLVWMLECNGLISNYQCGFRKKSKYIGPLGSPGIIH